MSVRADWIGLRSPEKKRETRERNEALERNFALEERKGASEHRLTPFSAVGGVVHVEPQRAVRIRELPVVG